MSTQIVSSVSTQQKSPLSETVISRLQAHRADGQQATVVQFPASFLKPISQLDLETAILLRNTLKRKQQELDSIEAELKARLEAGATVEEGVHIAELRVSTRRTVAWKAVAADLADTVFGDGKGESYCEDVLNSTVPTKTVNLHVE
jgi:hypothetical protein